MTDELTLCGLSSLGKSGVSAVLKDEEIQINALTLRQAGPHSTSARPESPLSLALVEFMIPLHF